MAISQILRWAFRDPSLKGWPNKNQVWIGPPTNAEVPIPIVTGTAATLGLIIRESAGRIFMTNWPPTTERVLNRAVCSWWCWKEIQRTRTKHYPSAQSISAKTKLSQRTHILEVTNSTTTFLIIDFWEQDDSEMIDHVKIWCSTWRFWSSNHYTQQIACKHQIPFVIQFGYVIWIQRILIKSEGKDTKHIAGRPSKPSTTSRETKLISLPKKS